MENGRGKTCGFSVNTHSAKAKSLFIFIDGGMFGKTTTELKSLTSGSLKHYIFYHREL